MKTESSLGALHQIKQNQIRTIADHDDRLRSALAEACEAASLADGIAAEIVENGVHRFTISANGEIKPLSAFPDIESFISQHKSASPDPIKSAVSAADTRAMKKAELYQMLAHYAATGDMAAYRETRSAWAKI